MQLKYGTYTFVANACDIKGSMHTRMNHGGQPLATIQRLDVAGFLQVAGQADCTAQMNAMASALSVPYKDLIFFDDNGAQTATRLANAGSISGVVIKDGPNFPENKGGEYSNYRKFTFSAEAEYPLAGTLPLLMSFTEKLTFKGGGPRRTIMLAVAGPHQLQTIYSTTPYEVFQVGEAVGYRGYPTPPLPIWPFALMESADIEPVSPERMGANPGRPGYQGYKIGWRYHFMSIRPLIGAPSLWL